MERLDYQPVEQISRQWTTPGAQPRVAVPQRPRK